MFSCKGCTAPKRHPGCHGHCQEYITERAEYDRLKAIYDREKDINCAIAGDRANKVYKAMKYRRNKKI